MAAADPRGPFSRSPALPPPRVRRPRGPAASSRVRPPGGCSHVAGAGGGEPAHGDHLPGKRAQQGPGPWGVEGGRPGGGVRPGVRGGLRPWKDRGSEFGAGGSGRAPRRLAVVARGRSGRGGDFTREHPPSPHSWRWRRPASYTFRSPTCREGVGEGGVGWGGVCPVPGGRVLQRGCSSESETRRRGRCARAPRDARAAPGSCARGRGRARRGVRGAPGKPLGGAAGLPASAPALGDPVARRASSPSAWAAPRGSSKMHPTFRKALTVTLLTCISCESVSPVTDTDLGLVASLIGLSTCK